MTASGNDSARQPAMDELRRAGGEGDIRLVGLVKRYNDVTAVDGIDMHIPPGEFFTMLGPSGCGKTTTLQLIAGFERPDDGKILLDGNTCRARRRTSGA